jgi:bacterioferritin
MTKQEMISLLNNDLRNEYAHMHFYLHSAIQIMGLHREELREFFLEEAASEMQHVREFGDLIMGLGGNPESLPNEFPTNLYTAQNILSHALSMEREVIKNYVERMDQATKITDVDGGIDGKWIEIFLEDQIMHSRKDVDNIRLMLMGL